MGSIVVVSTATGMLGFSSATEAAVVVAGCGVELVAVTVMLRFNSRTVVLAVRGVALIVRGGKPVRFACRDVTVFHPSVDSGSSSRIRVSLLLSTGLGAPCVRIDKTLPAVEFLGL